MTTDELLDKLHEEDYTVKEAMNLPEITTREPDWFNQDEFYLAGLPSPGFHNGKLLIGEVDDGWKAVGPEYDGTWKR